MRLLVSAAVSPSVPILLEVSGGTVLSELDNLLEESIQTRPDSLEIAHSLLPSSIRPSSSIRRDWVR